MDLDLQEFPEKSYKVLMNSPRTVEAAMRQGIKFEQLDPVNVHKVENEIKERDRVRSVKPDILNMHLQHAENKRAQLANMIKYERDAIIHEIEQG